MGAFEDALEWLIEKMGMWWPDADEGKLREAARHWRDFADAVGDITQATSGKAGTLIRTNSGEAIDAFDIFWGRYYKAGHGWLGDTEQAARDIAKALDDYAADVAQAKTDIKHKLAIDGTVIVLGIASAWATGGLSTSASTTAAAAMVRFAGTRAAALTTAIDITATTLTSAAIAGIEGITLNLAVAQPLQIAVGQRERLNLADAKEAGVWSAGFGAAFGGASSGIRNMKDADGIGPILQNFTPTLPGPRLSPAGGAPLPPRAGGGRPASGLDRYWLFAWKDIPKHVRDKIKSNWDAGNSFNRANHHRYPHNEVHLANGKQVDSYVPSEEIVSRKYSQLADVDPKTAKGYLSEFTSKYSPDTVIRSDKYPELDGRTLEGSMILEVPVQRKPIPQGILDKADEAEITIRDTNGHVYN